jgi:8-hydroxy-5-deazaflavin:NADPH oxidoreductase
MRRVLAPSADRPVPTLGRKRKAATTTVGFIGGGNIGGTVTRLAVGAGYDVVLSNSRGPQTLEDLVEDLAARARAAAPAEAAAAGDLVVVSIPPRAYMAVLVEPLAGKPVLDTINYIPQRDGRIPELYDGPLSSSEVLQRHLAAAHVVKVFNNITFWHLRRLARPAGATDRSALRIAGDDPIAKAAVTAFLDAIGYDRLDAGTLGTGGRRFEFGSPPSSHRTGAERRAGYPRQHGGTTRRSRRLRTGSPGKTDPRGRTAEPSTSVIRAMPPTGLRRRTPPRCTTPLMNRGASRAPHPTPFHSRRPGGCAA